MTAITLETLKIHTIPFAEGIPHGFWENRVEALSHPEFKAIYALPTRDEAARFSAEKILEQQTEKPDSTYTLPSSRQGNDVLRWVVRLAKEREISFDRAHFWHMDEYFPIDGNHQESFRRNLKETFFDPLGIRENHIHYICADPGADGDAVAADYEASLPSEGVDMVLAPLGPRHVAFDEPGAPSDCVTHLTRLSDSTIYRDHVERGLDTPEYAITQGIATLLKAKKILFIDFSPEYNLYMKEALYDPISSANTATYLRTAGGDVEVITTKEIADAVVRRETPSSV